MSATRDEPDAAPESASGNAGSDHDYFQALEEAFIRLRGAPLLLSPADWQMAKQWRGRGIPVDLIERVIGEVLEERRSRPGGDRIVTLRYFRKPVENAWKALGAIRASATQGESAAIDTPDRLKRLADSLPESLSGWRERILGLEGDPEMVESALTLLQDEILESLMSALGVEDGREMDLAIERTLATLSSQVAAEELESTRARLKRESVRRHFDLPMLSLFAAGD